MMFRGVKKRVTATRTLHRLVNRGLIVPEEVNLTLVSEVMAPSAKHHHFFFALLHSFLPHSPPVVKHLYLGQWYSDCREPPSPWNKRKQRKHSSAACLSLHGEKHHLQRGICSYSLCETHFLHGYGVLQQLGENQMSRLCFTKAVRAEIKMFKLSHRPPSDCLSGHPSSDFPSQRWHLHWLLFSWDPISWYFLLHLCLATWLLFHPRRGHSMWARHYCFTYLSFKFPSCMSPRGCPDDSLLHIPANRGVCSYLTCSCQRWSERELVCGRSLVHATRWITISWIWTINPHPNQFFFSPVGN